MNPKRTYFEELVPLDRALRSVDARIKPVHGNPADQKSFNSPSLDDRLEKQAAKLARRARRAGFSP